VGYLRCVAPNRPSHLLWRGLTKRCPRCGAGHLFRRWFDMKPNCPRCGYRFEREEGFFLGAYVINLAISEIWVVAVVVALIVQEARGRVGSLVPWLVVGGALQLLLPLLFYPFSKTIWAAIDLMMRPLDPHEEAEAVLLREDERKSPNP
jgi:uncharacterized protein (DUF983 family)